MRVLLSLLILLVCGMQVAFGYDQSRCSSANSKVSSTYSSYQSARTAYDYCTRYGDTSGSGYGSSNCGGAYSSMQSAKSYYDSAVSEQWQYCY
jgi:hypothetical protein